MAKQIGYNGECTEIIKWANDNIEYVSVKCEEYGVNPNDLTEYILLAMKEELNK